MKIVFLDSNTIGEVSNLNIFNSFGEFTSYAETTADEVLDRVRSVNIIITNKVLITKEVMEAAPELKLVCIAATGINNVDIQEANKRGIQIKNVAGYSTESVAQFTFAMLFYMLHSLAYYDKYVKTGDYSKSSMFTHHAEPFFELKDKIYGIIGLGNIGRRVGELAQGFGCKVIYYSTSGKNNSKLFKQVSLDELLTASDIISVHCPLNEQTNDLIKVDEIKKMKPEAYLLNLGRGGIINESDLAYAIDNNLIKGAMVDVLTKEPILNSNPLSNVKNKHKLLVTPHIAWASIEARELLIQKIYNNIEDFLKEVG